MRSRILISWILCALVFSVFPFDVQAVSVYSIDHGRVRVLPGGAGYEYLPCTLIAFDAEGNDLAYRDSVLLPQWGAGGIDIAVDNVTGTLFVTFEHGGSRGEAILLKCLMLRL